ncbi:phage tail protein [Pseudomonas putida]|uniref:phage tail protein n=1 Tax=Pseudomonas putida TaxID=303 RepID=UPI0035291B5E
MYDPVGAFKDVFGGVQGVFAGLTGAAKISGAPSSEPSSQTVRSSKAPVRFILGRASTGGVLAWVQEQSGDQTSGEWIHIVYVLSEGAIAGVDEIYVDERPLSDLGENATSEVIIDPTQVNAFLLANCPDWRQEQIGRRLSFVRLSFKYDAEKFPSGIPDVRFVVRGRSDIYDPRNGNSGYSANTALLILWYLRNRCAIPDDEIIFQSFASAANICDEAVIGPDGKMSPRYFAGAVIGADEKRNTVLDNLLSACAGTLIRVGGRWSLQVGAYYGPADFTINEDMVIGTVEGTTEVSNSDAINTMRGTFVDPAQAWAETDYPEVAIQDWIATDGGELAESQSFAYVTDAYLAQRLANISLRRRRSGGSLSVPLNFNGYNCRPGRAVKVDLPSLNILGEFMVTEWTMGAADACKVTLKPYEQAIFDDAVGQPYDPLGFINLPVGGLAAVTGLAWTPSGVAEVVQGVLSWAPPVQTVLSYTVTIRKGAEVVQSLKVGGEASSCNINGLTSGTYAMSVVAFGPGTRSGEATINVNVGGPPVPESCAVYASVDTITLVPANLQNSLNGGTYEYFYATNPSAPIADAVYLGQGLTFTHTGLAFAKEYSYYVRSANAYGKSDFLYVLAATSSDPTQMLEVIAGQITESELGQELTKRIDLIDMNGPGSVNERLGEVRNDLNQQISDVSNHVGEVQSELQQQIDIIADLADSMPYKSDQAYTAGQGVLGDDGRLYQAKGDVPAGNPPPNATYWIDIGQAVQTANGMAARVQTVETKVESLEGVSTAQSQQITGLQSSLTTTNGNVAAAQQAAQDAATLAGGKGKVIVQSAAPAVADRLAQNLWIDTTGNANTPKRWNGSAWGTVTDKVATDAAAAAANALAVAQTKADASAVQSLTTRVTDAEGALSSQSQAITGLNSSLTTTNQNVTAAQQAAQAAADAAGTKGKVLYQSTAPAVADRLTQNLWIDTTGNANTPKRWNGSAWVAVTDKVATDAAAAAASALSQVAVKADAAALQALSNVVEQHGTAITANGQAVTDINASLSQIGGENLLYNPSFDTPSAANANVADGWGWRKSTAVVVAPMLRNADLGAEGKCQRLDVTGLTAGTGTNYVDFVPSAASPDNRPPIYEGLVSTASVFVRGNTGLMLQIFLQYKDAAGATLATHGPANFNLTPTYQRAVLTGSAAPAGSVRTDILYRIRSAPGSSLTGGFVDLDNAQFEYGNVASGWRDNGKVNAAGLATNASATTALTGRVAATEEGLSSASGQLTQLENSIGEVGGENLFYNPTFSRPAAVSSQVVDGWEMEGGASSVESVVTSWLNSGEKAIRSVLGGVTSGSPYKSVRTPGPRRIKVAAGQTITASCYARRIGDNSLYFRIWYQWANDAGTVLSAVSSGNFAMSVAGDRFAYSAVAPANATQAIVYFRIHGTTSTAVSGTVEFARPQAEYGARATGWRDNGQLNAADNSATSAAVESLTSTVNQQAGTLSSVAGRTTSLENSLTTTNQNVTAAQQAAQAAATAAGAKGEVIYGSTAPAAEKRLAQNLWIDTTGNANTPKRWNGSAWAAVTDKVATDAATAAASALSQVATKAEASAVNSLTNRVSNAEGTLSSNSSDITQLKNSIGTAQPFVAGKAWEFIGSTQGWVGTISGSTFTAGPLFATAGKCPNLQCNFTPAIAGAESPYLRIRLRRRNTTRAGAQMYWANEDGGLAEARRMDWAINITTNDWQDIEFDLSGHAGWNGKNIIAIRLDMMSSADTSGEIDIAYIAVGRRSAAASAQAVASLESNVTQQGDKLTAEGKRIDGLYTAVGDANAAIQNEATARTNADTALSQQIKTTQSSLGDTNASVQQISTAQTGLNNRVNAQYSIKVAVTQSGVYALGGIGVGIQNQNGVLQSVVAVLADRFAVINATGDGFVSPFAVQGGQVFMNDSFIRDASITNAKIANAAITSAKIGVAEVDTLRIRGNAVTVPVAATSAGNVVGGGVGQWRDLIAVGVQMDEAGYITAQYSCYQGFGSGIRKYQFRMEINGLVLAEGGGDWADGFPNLMGSIGVGVGYFVITVKWWGENSGVNVQNHTLYAMGTKR